MKARRRHAGLDAVVDPLPFDYTLLSHLYVHSDGTDVIDFGGFAPGKESRGRVNSFLKNRSFAPGAYSAVAPETKGSYLHLRVSDRDNNDDFTCFPDATSRYNSMLPSHRPSSHTPQPLNEDASSLVRIEDSAEHWWFMCQTRESAAPYARQFQHAEDLGRYLDSHDLHLPTGELSDAETDTDDTNDPPNNEAGDEQRPRDSSPGIEINNPNSNSNINNSSGDTQRSPAAAASAKAGHVTAAALKLPLAKWLDVQIDRSQPDSAERVTRLLDLLPVSQETKDSCLYLSMADSVDINSAATGEASDTTSGYVFLNLMCTPVVDVKEDEGGAAAAPLPQSAAGNRKSGFLHHLTSPHANAKHNAGKPSKSKKAAKPQQDTAAVARANRHGRYSTTRSVMEMHFEAVRTGAPRSSVPDAVAVGVIVFADWIFTIHDKPFAEMDDLLRMVQLHCAPPEQTAPHPHNNVLLAPSMRRRFTTSFILSVFLQIAVGHHLDSITLAHAVDELGDHVFSIKEKQQDQDEVVKRITALRRCFGECGAATARREVVFATLLQPMFAEQFFVADPAIRRELENAQAHLWQFQREISDCRDTVAVSNWYHNVAIQWVLLRRGNRALRMVLLLTEVANIMYPIVMLQTLYAMNVRVPFEADGDPPNTSLVPFFVLAAVFLAYSALTFRAVHSLITRRSFQTQLLA